MYPEISQGCSHKVTQKGPPSALCHLVFNPKPVCLVVPTLYFKLQPQPLSWAPSLPGWEEGPLDKSVKADAEPGKGRSLEEGPEEGTGQRLAWSTLGPAKVKAPCD